MIRRAPLLSAALVLHVVLALACSGLKDRADRPGRDEDPGDGPLPTPDAPVVTYLTWDVHGDTWPEELEEESMVCPPGSTYLGGNSYAAACLDEDLTASAYVLADTEHQTWPEDVDDPAAICPGGWGFAGGNYWYSVCTHTQAQVVWDIFYGPEGEDVAEVGLDACGDGVGLGFGYYGSAVCAASGQRGLALIAVDAEGRTSEDVDASALCADGWDFRGTSWYGTSVCVGPEGTVVGLTRDTEGRTWPEDLDAAAELCPQGWQHLGSYSGTEYCFTGDRLTVLNLTRDTEGRTWPEDLDEEALLCPEGWAHLGGVAYATVCAR